MTTQRTFFTACISDYGNNSTYEPALMTMVLGVDARVRWHSFSNTIKPKSFHQAGFLIRSVWDVLPEYAIILVAIDCDTKSYNQVFVLQHENKFIVTFNDAIAKVLFPEQSISVHSFHVSDFVFNPSFAELQIFPQLVKWIVDEKWKMATPKTTIYQKEDLQKVQQVNDSLLKATIIHVDGYQNLITNLEKHHFEDIFKKYKSFEIQYSKRDRISKLVKHYSEEESGSVVALFNQNNLLEIAMVDGEASSLLGFKVGSNILIQFYD